MASKIIGLYLAYGSNMNLCQMARRCPEAEPYKPALLRGYRLHMNRHATILSTGDSADFVPVALWRVTRECLRNLDLYEGVPTYYKRVLFSDRIAGYKVWTYVMNYAGDEPASVDYLDVITEGYEDFNHEAHIDSLRKFYERALRLRSDGQRAKRHAK